MAYNLDSQLFQIKYFYQQQHITIPICLSECKDMKTMIISKRKNCMAWIKISNDNSCTISRY